jgi:hypothetical protein
MISMGYDLRCETFHFALRKIRFVFAGFGLVDAGNEMGGWSRRSASRRMRAAWKLRPKKVAQKSS